MNNKLFKKLFCTISFVVLLLFLGISVTNAYYNNSDSISILASIIGDFDSGDGDINMMFYKQNDEGKYVRTYAIPALGYIFDDTQTKCSMTCSNTDSNATCYYSYDEENKTITMASDEKATCKFYFNKEASSDVTINILKEDETGTYAYNSKKYSLSEIVPAYGYKYIDVYSCNNSSSISYDSDTKKFSIQSPSKDTCYVYFDKDGSTADVITNVYVQSESDGVYTKVETIPQNKIYKLSETETSLCTDESGTDTNATITYIDGYINIDASAKQTCNVYLDLAS